ncbi:MAG: hypothetical protein IPK78_04165 [Rhodospirillales bacterium]|nr:hypothetical protein [Rhodospirillales bacterium]
MTTDIAWLNTPDPIDRTRFGAKASNLQLASSLGATVAHGFCISASAVQLLATSTAPTALVDTLQDAYGALINMTGTPRVILRSSSVLEDTRSHQFAGMFSSYHSLYSFDEILQSIELSFLSSRRTSITPYFRRHRLDQRATHLSLMVQEEKACLHSATIYADDNKIYCEITKGGVSNTSLPPNNLFSFCIRRSATQWILETPQSPHQEHQTITLVSLK